MTTTTTSPTFGAGAPPGRLIKGDLECEQCGYSLHGLYTRSPCPECGTFISDRVAGRDLTRAENLVDAPLGYLRRLVFATSMTALVGVAMTLGQLYLAVFNFPGRGVVQIVSPVLWIVAVWLVTMPRPRTESTSDDYMLDRSWVRWLVRATQFGWPIGVAGLVAPAMLAGFGVSVPTWSANVAATLGSFLVFVAAIGLAPLCLYLASLADWANAGGDADRLRTAAFFTGICGTLTVVLGVLSMLPGLLAPITGVLSIIAGVLAMFGIALLVYSMIQLALLATWAVNNWHDARAREQRMEQRRRDREAHTAQRVARIADAQAAGIARPAMRVSQSEYRIDRAEADDEPIELLDAGPNDRDPGTTEEHSADGNKPVRRFGNEVVRERDDSVTPYGLESDDEPPPPPSPPRD